MGLNLKWTHFLVIVMGYHFLTPTIADVLQGTYALERCMLWDDDPACVVYTVGFGHTYMSVFHRRLA